MNFKKATSVVLTAAMALTMNTTVFAAEQTVDNGVYTGTVHFYKQSDPTTYSMCDSIFVHTADVEVTNDSAELTFYVAYPIPNFSTQCDGGTIYDVVMTLDGEEYEGVCDIDTKAKKVFDANGSLFGITQGESYETEAVTVTLPREAVDSFYDGIETSVFVNPVMHSTQSFVVKVNDLEKVADNSNADADTEVTTNEQSMEITADVEEVISKPSYTVTVPASTALGKLSADEDNTMNYEVTVSASDLDGELKVEAPENGELKSGDNTLSFTNNFGTQTVTADADNLVLNGTLGVSASEVSNAKAGNYTGTTTFTISYTANK